jgi:hypothetical protein
VCYQACQLVLPWDGNLKDVSPFKKSPRVSLCDATHWRRANALQTLLEAAAVSCDGLRSV